MPQQPPQQHIRPTQSQPVALAMAKQKKNIAPENSANTKQVHEVWEDDMKVTRSSNSGAVGTITRAGISVQDRADLSLRMEQSCVKI